jgi:tetratricopeptide (TPR) repeat protein
VIGNAKYETAAGPLRNTSRDAKAVAKTLRALGFAVLERHDLKRNQLLQAVADFRKTLPGSEVALFYFAGHGISVSGSNYLIPIGSGYSPEGADDVTLRMLAETRLFNVEQAVADMSAARARCNLVILDACRSSALARTGRTRGSERGGLAEMSPPAGSLIAFATDAGQTALDGDGTNGLYTEELLKYLRTPGLTIEQVFKRTRAGVLERSGGSQIPAEYSRLIGDDIYLAGPVSSATAEAVDRVLKAEAAQPLNISAINQLAAAGNATACVPALESMAQQQGPGAYAAAALSTLLEVVKDDLKEANPSSPKIAAAENTCELVLRALSKCLPATHPLQAPLTAKAQNRRGDALLLMGRAAEALEAFTAAQPLAPEDSYILFNRGRAQLALGNADAARADFTAAAQPRFNQPKARKLALDALSRMP